MSKTRKILSWIPIFGFWAELYYVLFTDKPLYLSDREHKIRFYFSGIYHGASPFIIANILIIGLLS